jgi:hypothetical protein
MDRGCTCNKLICVSKLSATWEVSYIHPKHTQACFLNSKYRVSKEDDGHNTVKTILALQDNELGTEVLKQQCSNVLEVAISRRRSPNLRNPLLYRS